MKTYPIEILVKCEWCGAAENEPCMNPDTREIYETEIHLPRYYLFHKKC